MKRSLGRTKTRLLKELEAGPQTAADLAKRLALSPVAVHRHLRDLEARGLVGYELEKNGRGRPAKRWRLIRDGFCQGVLVKVRARLGRGELVALFVEWYRERLGALPRDPAALRARLVAEGYRTELLKGNGRLQLLQRRCPRLELARAFPELCEAEARAYAEKLGTAVTLKATLAEGDTACRFCLGEP
jgi:predicted ArsR family transcriptional regulator